MRLNSSLAWIALAIFALTSVACAPMYIWVHPSGDQTQLDRDSAQCEYEATAATQQIDYSYRTTFGQELDRAIRRNEIGVLCMKAKGYSQRPITGQ